MNLIERLDRDVIHEFESAFTRLDVPADERGSYWLDIRHLGHEVTVRWAPDRPFGVSSSLFPVGYGEGSDEVFDDYDTARRRVFELVRHKGKTIPPEKVALRELRDIAKFTQAEIAKRLGVGQAAISKLERRSDMSISSLQRFVRALGGKLRLKVDLSGESIELSGIGVAQEPPEARCTHIPMEHTTEGSLEVSRLSETVHKAESIVSRELGPTGPLSRVLLSEKCRLASFSNGDVRLNEASVISLAAQIQSQTGRTVDCFPIRVAQLLIFHELGHKYLDRFSSRFGVLGSAEEIADTFAGWLDALTDGCKESGSAVFAQLGCEHIKCDYPGASSRLAAYNTGFEISALTRAVPRLDLLVLRVADIELSRRFYSCLGAKFEQEKHGRGPVHYAGLLNGTVFELYPCNKSSAVSSLRLGFKVEDLNQVVERARQAGATVESREDGDQYVLQDPDGNKVVLSSL